MNGLILRSILIIALSPLMVVVACIKIQTGPQTADEAKESSEVRGKGFRVEWATRLDAASPREKINLVRTLIDSVGASYLRYGRNVSEQWRQGSAGRGEAIKDTEMQAIVQRWNEGQQPVMKAYEEVIEKGLDQIDRTRAFDRRVLDKLAELRDHFYKVYATVFFPRGTTDTYNEKLDLLARDGQRIGTELDQEMNRYR